MHSAQTLQTRAINRLFCPTNAANFETRRKLKFNVNRENERRQSGLHARLDFSADPRKWKIGSALLFTDVTGGAREKANERVGLCVRSWSVDFTVSTVARRFHFRPCFSLQLRFSCRSTIDTLRSKRAVNAALRNFRAFSFSRYRVSDSIGFRRRLDVSTGP